MIQANELRVGNWVQTLSRSTTYSAYQIQSLDIVGASQIELAGKEQSMAPILLTPEILHVCLAEYELGYYSITDDIVINVDGQVYSIANNNASTWIAECHKVHQLQNLYFALTGQELEIKPPPQPTIKALYQEYPPPMKDQKATIEESNMSTWIKNYKMKNLTKENVYMQEQKKHPMQFGAYTLPEQWQLDAMEAYAKQKSDLNIKLLDAIKNMIGSVLMRCTYYHKSATFVETDRGKYMIRVEPYDPPKMVLDVVAPTL